LCEEAIEIAKARHVSLYSGHVFPDLSPAHGGPL
jgi:hypothetical protein